jgi:hypothetical protein
MATNRLQIGLIATLALGLGFSLASSPAIGYPAGAAVSMGSNPRWSATKSITSLSSATVLTVPAGQVAIVTGLSSNGWSRLSVHQDDTQVLSGDSFTSSTNNLFQVGNGNLRIESGTTLTVQHSHPDDTYSVYIEGYYAQE